MTPEGWLYLLIGTWLSWRLILWLDREYRQEFIRRSRPELHFIADDKYLRLDDRGRVAAWKNIAYGELDSKHPISESK